MQLHLINRAQLGGNAWAYTFKPSAPLTWTAGQAIRVDLPHPRPDAEGTDRYFTIASAPHDSVVTIATRHTNSTFKQALHQLRVGEPLTMIEAPSGTFSWRASPHPLIFVAQGIGITPFYSMLRDRLRHHPAAPARLFHSNYLPDIPYRRELEALASAHPELKLTFLTERITPAYLAAQVPALPASQVFVSGPSSLIGLMAPPINLPAKQLNQDSFPNYATTAY